MVFSRRLVAAVLCAAAIVALALLWKGRAGPSGDESGAADNPPRTSDQPLLTGRGASDDQVLPVAGTDTPATAEGATLRLQRADRTPVAGVSVSVGDYNALPDGLTSLVSDERGLIGLDPSLLGVYCRYEIDSPLYAPTTGPFLARGTIDVTLQNGARVYLELAEADTDLIGQTAHYAIAGVVKSAELTARRTLLGSAIGEVRIDKVGRTRPAQGSNQFLVPTTGDVVLRFVPEGRTEVLFALNRDFQAEDTFLFASRRGDRYAPPATAKVDERDSLRMKARLGHGRHLVMGRNGDSVCIADVSVAPADPDEPRDLPWQRGCALTLELPPEVQPVSAAVFLLAAGQEQIAEAQSSIRYHRTETPTGWLDVAHKMRPLPKGRRWPQEAEVASRLVTGLLVPADTLVRCSVRTAKHGVLVRDTVIKPDATRMSVSFIVPNITRIVVEGAADSEAGQFLVSIWKAGPKGPKHGVSPEQVRLDSGGTARVVGLQAGQRYAFQIRGNGLLGSITRRVVRNDTVSVRMAAREVVEKSVRVVDSTSTPLGNVLVTFFSREGDLSDRRISLTDAQGLATGPMPKGMTVSATVSDPRYISPYVDVPSSERVLLRARAAGSVTLVNRGPERVLMVEYKIRDRFVPVPPRRLFQNAEWKLGRVPSGSLRLKVQELDGAGVPIRTLVEEHVRVGPLKTTTVELD